MEEASSLFETTRRLDSPHRLYLGIDPGADGALVAIGESGLEGSSILTIAKSTERDLWTWLSRLSPTARVAPFAIIEQQHPRPTKWWDVKRKDWTSTILRSTCILYGYYCTLRAMLIAAGIPHEEIVAKTWQTSLKIPPRESEEKDTDWKNRLKAKAQALFPKEHITLANADAVLIAEYCRRKCEGKL